MSYETRAANVWKSCLDINPMNAKQKLDEAMSLLMAMAKQLDDQDRAIRYLFSEQPSH